MALDGCIEQERDSVKQRKAKAKERRSKESRCSVEMTRSSKEVGVACGVMIVNKQVIIDELE